MRLPGMRIRVRGMMVAVLLAAVGLKVGRVWQRSLDYRRQARYHALLERQALQLARNIETKYPIDHFTLEENQKAAASSRRLAAFSARLRRKYEYATSHPWLPVEPDSPPP